MRITRKIVIETALVLAAGAVLAASGGAAGLIALTGLDAVPIQASSAPHCVVVEAPGTDVAVGHLSSPSGCTLVSTGSGEILGSNSAPSLCVDILTTTPRVSVGSASVPGGCVAIRVPGSVGEHSVPIGRFSAPVANASMPRCVVVTPPGADVRTHC